MGYRKAGTRRLHFAGMKQGREEVSHPGRVQRRTCWATLLQKYLIRDRPKTGCWVGTRAS